jgi:hypothetical protein
MFWSVGDALAEGGLGAVLTALAVFGLATVLHRAARTGDWATAGLPAGLCVGFLAFAGLTALARAEVSPSPDSYASSRYVHVAAALLLPIVAVGAEHLARRRALAGALVLVPPAVGLPGNVGRLADTPPPYTAGRDVVLSVAHSPYLDEVPADTRVLRARWQPLTTGWLSRQAAAGRVPELDDADPRAELTATGRIVLTQGPDATDGEPCPFLHRAVDTVLQRGDELRFDGALDVIVTDGADASRPRTFRSIGGSVVRASAGPIDVVVRPTPSMRARLCPPTDD